MPNQIATAVHPTPTVGRPTPRRRAAAAALRAASAPAVERLEGRRLFAAATFTGSGAWTDASHWSTHAVPAFGDSATIAAGATVTVAALQDVDAITNAGTIDFTTDAGTFNLGNVQTLTNAGTIEKTGGTGTTTILPGNQDSTLADTGGTISATTGTISIASAAVLNGTHLAPAAGTSVAFDQVGTNFANTTSISGTLAGTGAGAVLFRTGGMYNQHQAAGDTVPTGTLNFPAGMAQVTGFGFETYGGDAQIVNAGELDYVGTAAHADVNLVNQGTIINKGSTDLVNGDQTGFLNDTAGTVDLTTDAGIGYQANGHGGNLTVTNKGLIQKTGGSGVSRIGSGGGINFDSEGGRYAVTSGTLSLEGNDTLAGGTGIDVAANTAFQFDLNDTTDNLSGQSTSVAGTITGTGAGHVLLVSGAMYNQHQTAGDTIATATLGFPAGMAQVTGYAFETYGGDAQVVNAGELDYVGTAAHADVNLENAGTIVNKGTADLVNGDQTGFLNDATGVINLTTDAGISYLANGHGGNLTFTNKGLLEKTGGTGTSYLGDMAATSGIGFQNRGGSVTVSSGTLELVNGHGDAVYDYGPITVAAGSVFDVSIGTGRMFTTGTFAVAGGGTVQFDGGQWYGPNDYFGQDTTTASTLAFAPGTFQLRGGDFADNNPAHLVNTGEIDLAGANDLSGLANKGTVRVTDAGPLASTLGFVNEAGGLLRFDADAVVTDGYHANINNAGTILKAGGSGTIDLSANSLTNTGKIECGSGTIKLGTYGQTLPAPQTFQADAGGTITTADNAITDVEGTAILGGPGASIPAIAGLTTVGGTVAVYSGATFATAGDLAVTGTLTVGGHVAVTGALAQSGTLSFAVAAAPGTAGAPSLTVAGATTLAGGLRVAVTSDMTITAGTTYTVATFAAPATGTFATTNAADFTPTVTPTTIALNSSGTTPTPSPTPTPTPTPTGTLTPTVSRSTVPADVVGTVRHAGKVTVSVTSTAPAVSSGKDSILLYATTTGAVDGASLVLRQLTRPLTFKPGVAKLFTLAVQTQTLPAGTYTLLVQTTDANGLLTTAAAGPSLVVEPPVVTLSATAAAVTPAAPKAGRKATVAVALANTGNIDSTAPLTVSVGLSTDASGAGAVAVTSSTHRLRVRANGRPTKLKVTFTVPAGLTAAAYYPVVTIAGTVPTPATSTASAVGPSFTPAG